MEVERCDKCGRFKSGQVICVEGLFAFICYGCIDEADYEQYTWRRVG